jgi:hypothetical protein
LRKFGSGSFSAQPHLPASATQNNWNRPLWYAVGMPQELLRRALEHALRSDPPIKAAALLHIARVLTVFNREQCLSVFDLGIALARTLSEHEKDVLLAEGFFLAGAVDPQRAIQLFGEGWPRMRHPHPMERLLTVMLDHGHVEKAVTYLTGPLKADEYPFFTVSAVLQKCADDATRLQVLRAALHAWVQKPPSRPGPAPFFLHLFSQKWKILPRGEATERTREIVAAILREPDHPASARIGTEPNGMVFRSSQAFQLFQFLNVLRELTPELLDSLLQAHEELAAGAERFPMGMESVMANTPKPAVAAKGQRFGYAGSPEGFAVAMAKIEAERVGNFEPHFEEALRLYAEDWEPESPNRAPRECWPSTQAFRDAMYRSGKRHGRDAVGNLDRIPDPDLRLLAEIELIAAVAGLPEYRGVRCIHRARN